VLKITYNNITSFKFLDKIRIITSYNIKVVVLKVPLQELKKSAIL